VSARTPIHWRARHTAFLMAFLIVAVSLCGCTLQTPPYGDATYPASNESVDDSLRVASQPTSDQPTQSAESPIPSQPEYDQFYSFDTVSPLPDDYSQIDELLGEVREMMSRLVSLAPAVLRSGAPDDSEMPVGDTISIAFTSPTGRIGTTSKQFAAQARQSTTLDSDGDGVPDSLDLCGQTPMNAIVNQAGCPTDEDGDGVFDGIDQCPGTPNFVRMVVDSAGCPADEDGDGVPDYLDYCPGTPRGFVVTKLGCLPDGDADGVADIDDHCPDTPKGMAVDASGCLLMTQLHRHLALKINYVPGTEELDRLSQRILDDLAVRMADSPGVIAVIEGFTEEMPNNLSSLVASQDNVERVIHYLAARGVDEGRIKASSVPDLERAESQSATVAGLPENYRIEISFYSPDE